MALTPVGQGQPDTRVTTPKPLAADGVAVDSDLRPTGTIPQDKKDIGMLLFGLTEEQVQSNKLFNDLYIALKDKKQWPLIRGGVEIIDKDGYISQDAFEYLLKQFGNPQMAKDLRGENFKYCLGNQGRSSENSGTNYYRIMVFLKQSKYLEGVSSFVVKDQAIREQVRKLLTERLNFVVVGTGEMGKAFLRKYVPGSNQTIDRAIKKLYEDYDIPKDKPVTAIDDIYALRAFEAFIATLMLNHTYQYDNQNRGTTFTTKTGELVDIFESVLEGNKTLAVRTGEAAADFASKGVFPDLSQLDTPLKPIDIIEEAAGEYEKLKPDTGSIMVRGAPVSVDDVDEDDLASMFEDDIWALVEKSSEFPEIQERLNTSPSSADEFKALVRQYLEKGYIGEKPQELTDLQDRERVLEEEIGKLKPEQTAEKEAKMRELAKNRRDQKKLIAKAFIDAFLKRGQEVKPGQDGKAYGAFAQSVQRDAMAGLFGGE